MICGCCVCGFDLVCYVLFDHDHFCDVMICLPCVGVYVLLCWCVLWLLGLCRVVVVCLFRCGLLRFVSFVVNFVCVECDCCCVVWCVVFCGCSVMCCLSCVVLCVRCVCVCVLCVVFWYG